MLWYERRNQIFNDLKQSIKDFRLFIKKFYLIVWSVEKIQKVKSQGMKK